MYKILLTVDDAIARKNFQDQLNLKLSGSEIVFTNNTHETTAFLAQNRVSLVVLDLHSFQVDSFNILAIMTHEYPKTPCFILGDHTLLETDAKSELYHYVQKPYDLEDVTSKIAHIVRADAIETTPKGMPVATFMQLVSKEAKTCLLGVYPVDGGDRGLFYFEKGILFDAVQSKLKGENAALKMLSISGAEIHSKDIQKKIGRKINTSLLALIEKLGEPGPRHWEEEPQQGEETAAEEPAAPKQTQPIPEPAPIAKPNAIAAEPVEIDEELPLFPSDEEIDKEEETQEPEPIESIAEPQEETVDEPETIAAAQEATAMDITEEEPPLLEPIEEESVAIAAEEVNKKPTPTDTAATAPKKPERPVTRDYFDETAGPRKPKEIKKEAASKETEKTAPSQAVEKEPGRPKTIDYFEKVEARKPQEKPAAAEEAELDKPKTRDYGGYGTKTQETKKDETIAEPLSEPPEETEYSTSKTDDVGQTEPIEDIVSILEAEPGEVDEEFEEVDEKPDAAEVVDPLEILEEEDEQEEVVEPTSPEPEPEILFESTEEDVLEEPAEIVAEKPEEIVFEFIGEDDKEEETVSNETIEEVVAPIETAIQEKMPQPDSGIDTDPKNLWNNSIGDLREIRGYKAAAVLNFDGEVAVFDSVDPTIHLNTIGATFNSLFWLSQDAFNRVGLKEFNELILSTPTGLVVIISSGKKSPRQFHLIGILADDGNQNLMRFKFGNLAQKMKNVPA